LWSVLISFTLYPRPYPRLGNGTRLPHPTHTVHLTLFDLATPLDCADYERSKIQNNTSIWVVSSLVIDRQADLSPCRFIAKRGYRHADLSQPAWQ